VLTFATPNSVVHAETAREVLTTIGLSLAPAVFHRYDVHRLANVSGLTAQELEPNCVAASEVRALWEWLRAILQIGMDADLHTGTSAHVHKGAV
jgi:hypothetical protein